MGISARTSGGYVAMMVAVTLLSACGGGGVNGVALTGKVIDGYLRGAVVCLDVNNNKTCDANEPTATSGPGGAFSLNPPSNLDLSTVRLIANVPATAIDEDTGIAVGAAYQLTAPANLTVVTPLTTLALSYKDQSGTWVQAIASVKTNLGISDAQFKVDIDYVAEANVKTHNVARLIAGVIQTNQVNGSENLRSIVAGLSSYANTAFNSSAPLLVAELNSLVNTGASAVRQRVFASAYQQEPNWIESLQVYKQGNSNTLTGIWGEEKSTGDPWYWSGNIGVAGADSPNGAGFWWNTSIPFPGGFMGSWVMEPGGFDITGMGKINIKAWSSNEVAGSPTFTPILESMAINGCIPQAKSTSVLTAPAIREDYVIVNQSDASFQLSLNSFIITESCGNIVNSMSEFISRPLKTVRVRIYEANKNSVSAWNAINLGTISFEP